MRPTTITDPEPTARTSSVTGEPRPTDPARRLSRTEVVTLVLGLALAVVVGVDGPAPWAPVRAMVALIVTGAVMYAIRRTGTHRRGTPLVVFGLVGIIAGGAIGVFHAVKVGVTVESVAGIAALATGVWLVGVGTVTLTRRARGWRKLLAVPVGVGVAVLVVAPLTLATAVTNPPPLELGDATPDDAGLTYEDVSLRTDDGVRLTAWYVSSTNGAAVVVLPGAGSTRSAEIDHAAVLARHGYGVLLVDVRGHGGSDGDAMLWGWFGDADVHAAVTWLGSRPDVTPSRIGAVGMSMGAEEAIGAAASDPRIQAVVAEGATARGARDEGDPATGAGGLFTRYIDWTTAHAADLMTAADRPIKLRDAVAAASPRPIMIIAAGTLAPEVDAAHVFQAAAPSSVELWIVPGAKHTEAYDVHPVEWERRVIAFLDASLP